MDSQGTGLFNQIGMIQSHIQWLKGRQWIQFFWILVRLLILSLTSSFWTSYPNMGWASSQCTRWRTGWRKGLTWLWWMGSHLAGYWSPTVLLSSYMQSNLKMEGKKLASLLSPSFFSCLLLSLSHPFSLLFCKMAVLCNWRQIQVQEIRGALGIHQEKKTVLWRTRELLETTANPREFILCTTSQPRS